MRAFGLAPNPPSPNTTGRARGPAGGKPRLTIEPQEHHEPGGGERVDFLRDEVCVLLAICHFEALKEVEVERREDGRRGLPLGDGRGALVSGLRCMANCQHIGPHEISKEFHGESERTPELLVGLTCNEGGRERLHAPS